MERAEIGAEMGTRTRTRTERRPLALNSAEGGQWEPIFGFIHDAIRSSFGLHDAIRASSGLKTQ